MCERPLQLPHVTRHGKHFACILITPFIELSHTHTHTHTIQYTTTEPAPIYICTYSTTFSTNGTYCSSVPAPTPTFPSKLPCPILPWAPRVHMSTTNHHRPRHRYHTNSETKPLPFLHTSSSPSCGFASAITFFFISFFFFLFISPSPSSLLFSCIVAYFPPCSFVLKLNDKPMTAVHHSFSSSSSFNLPPFSLFVSSHHCVCVCVCVILKAVYIGVHTCMCVPVCRPTRSKLEPETRLYCMYVLHAFLSPFSPLFFIILSFPSFSCLLPYSLFPFSSFSNIIFVRID